LSSYHQCPTFLATLSPLDLCMLVLHLDKHLDTYGMNN